MLKKAAGLLLVCASMALWVSCATTSSHYLYAAQPTANDIVAYREDPNSGVLTLLSVSPIAAGPAVQALALHPSKKYLYAANTQENDISLFMIDTTGVLTEQGLRAKTDTAPTLLAMNAAGSFLYVGNSGSNDISVFSIDAGSGSLTAMGTPLQLGLTPTQPETIPFRQFSLCDGRWATGKRRSIQPQCGSSEPGPGADNAGGNQSVRFGDRSQWGAPLRSQLTSGQFDLGIHD